MIRHSMSAAYLLRDGFTGTVLTDGSATRCFLDGRPLSRPLWKREGYLVLTDLDGEEHLLQISRRGYRDELVTIPAQEFRPVEDTVTLKPGIGYRFPRETVRVSLTLRRGENTAAGERLWLGMAAYSRLKLAQEKTESGDGEAHLFCDGNAALLPVPGHFLLSGGKEAELVYLSSLRGETGVFLPPLTLSHSRGAELIPMQSYVTDGEGTVQVLLRRPGKLTGFFDGRAYEAELHSGSQELEWKTEG